ncbi:hypothetical protein D3C73_1214590 [compost metagenome]
MSQAREPLIWISACWSRSFPIRVQLSFVSLTMTASEHSEFMVFTKGGRIILTQDYYGKQGVCIMICGQDLSNRSHITGSIRYFLWTPSGKNSGVPSRMIQWRNYRRTCTFVLMSLKRITMFHRIHTHLPSFTSPVRAVCALMSPVNAG